MHERKVYNLYTKTSHVEGILKLWAAIIQDSVMQDPAIKDSAMLDSAAIQNLCKNLCGGGGGRASHEPLSPCSLYLKYQVLACFDKQMPLETGFVTPPAFQDTGNSTEVRLSLQNHLSPGGSATVCWHRWNGHALMSGCPTSMPKRPGPFLARTTWKLSATASTKLCGASDFGHRSN